VSDEQSGELSLEPTQAAVGPKTVSQSTIKAIIQTGIL